MWYSTNTANVLIEYAGEGTDTVRSSVTYTLGANIENLTLTGGIGSYYFGTGNALDNVLTGNGSHSTLDGGAGADTMIGGVGNDIYVVDNSGDVVIEYADGWIDTVQSSITYTLGANVENLTLTGAATINGTGNALNNALTGNSYANTLTGAAGNDTLTGRAGNDTYEFGRGGAADTIVENDSTAGNTDLALFTSSVASDQIWLQHVGNNLEVSIIGTSDKLTIKDWYLGSIYHVEQFKTTDGNKLLLDANVENLVQAMAAFSPPASGQTTLPPSYESSLAPVIAANWQ